MSRISWKSYRVISACILAFGFYYCLKLNVQSINTSMILQNTTPESVWEYVADFSNMKTLNPTVVSFNILSESGNYDHWKYTVEYTELLSHWPYLENVAIGTFSVKKDKSDYVIESHHETCFAFGFYCVRSVGEFRFSVVNELATQCKEHVTFECPTLFSSFCIREARYQRTEIMENLRRHFNPYTI